MDAPRKPNSNSRLKTLPPARQDAIAEFARDHSLKETVAWLRADGFSTSSAALSEWLGWYALRKRAEERAAKIDAFLAEEKSNHPELTDAELFDRGQRMFSLIAMAEESAKDWTALQTVALKRGALALDRDKLELLTAEKFLDKRLQAKADEINASPLSHADKIAAMRQAAFADVDALEASGEVELPA